MGMLMSRKIGGWLLALLFAGPIAYAQAGGTKTVNMTLHLAITQPPPCTVDDITVVMPGAVSDARVFAIVDFNIPVTCTWDVREAYRSLKLQIQGATTTINQQQVLQTSEPNLGIRITDGRTRALVPLGAGNWVTLNTAYSTGGEGGMDYRFELRAEPVKRVADEVYQPQTYSASATTILEYE